MTTAMTVAPNAAMNELRIASPMFTSRKMSRYQMRHHPVDDERDRKATGPAHRSTCRFDLPVTARTTFGADHADQQDDREPDDQRPGLFGVEQLAPPLGADVARPDRERTAAVERVQDDEAIGTNMKSSTSTVTTASTGFSQSPRALCRRRRWRSARAGRSTAGRREPRREPAARAAGRRTRAPPDGQREEHRHDHHHGHRRAERPVLCTLELAGDHRADHVALGPAEHRGGDVVAAHRDERQQHAGCDARRGQRQRDTEERRQPTRTEVLAGLAHARSMRSRATNSGRIMKPR